MRKCPDEGLKDEAESRGVRRQHQCVAHLLVIHFNVEFASTPPQAFVRQLVESSRPLREICVGHEWSFGKNRAGNLALLQKLGTEHHFNVVGLKPVTVSGTAVAGYTVLTPFSGFSPEWYIAVAVAIGLG